jgi:hypothetical protein
VSHPDRGRTIDSTSTAIGADLDSTGMISLESALERQLGRPCHHMMGLGHHDDGHVGAWHQGLDVDISGEPLPPATPTGQFRRRAGLEES